MSGWLERPLADLLSEPLRNGRSVPTARDGFPVLRLTAIKKGSVDLGERKTGAWTVSDARPYLVTAGDFMIARGNGSLALVGRGGLVRVEPDHVAFPDTMIRARPDRSRVVPEYLALVWESDQVRRQVERSARTSAGIYKVSQLSLAAVKLPIPPLPEQRRIVAILEEHLSDLDDGMASLNRARTRSTAFLTAAVADEFDRLPGGERLLGDLAEGVKNGIFVSRAKAEPDGVPILRIGAVRPLRLDLSDLRYSAQSAEALAAGDALLAPGDVLFTRYNGNPRYVGACAVVPNGIGAITWPDKLIRVRLRADTADPGFVAYACSFGRGRRAIESSLKTSAGQVGISGRELRNIRIRVPHLAIQREVGERLASRAEDADRLERAAEASRRRANSLRGAVLTAAFSGRLTGHGSDTDVIKELAEEKSA